MQDILELENNKHRLDDLREKSLYCTIFLGTQTQDLKLTRARYG